MRPQLSRRLMELEKLTRARERAARAKLAEIGRRKREEEDEVANLRQQRFESHTSIEAQLVSKWQVWQKAELVRRNRNLASIELEYRQAMQECGRQIAEQAVLARLVKDAKHDELAEQQRRAAFTSPDERCP